MNRLLVLWLVLLSVVCLSHAEENESRYDRSQMFNDSRRRRLMPAEVGSDTTLMEYTDEGYPYEFNETSISDILKTGDDEETKDDKEYVKQLAASMSFSISISKVSKASKKTKASKKSESSESSTSTDTPVPSNSKKSKKSNSSEDTTSPAPDGTSPPSSSSKKSKTSKKSSKQSKGDTNGSRKYQGNFVRLSDYNKSCSSSGSCIQRVEAFCMGGMDVVHEFAVEDFGQVSIHMDIAWSFAGYSSKCGTVSRKAETLLGRGWLPITLANSYICYTEYVYRIPESPNLNEQLFTGKFDVTMPGGELVEGQILSGAVCELYSESDVYLEINSYAILAMIPGYSIFLQYEIDERTMEVMEFLSGAPHITIQEDNSFSSGRWDHLRPDGAILQGK